MHGYPHTSGGLLAILMGGGGAYHYLSVVQTNSATGANHYSFVVQTNSDTWCKPILVRASTYIGRYYLPSVGVGAQAAEAVALLCGRTCAFSRHCFW